MARKIWMIDIQVINMSKALRGLKIHKSLQ
jgi:hypothetical protein